MPDKLDGTRVRPVNWRHFVALLYFKQLRMISQIYLNMGSYDLLNHARHWLVAMLGINSAFTKIPLANRFLKCTAFIYTTNYNCINERNDKNKFLSNRFNQTQTKSTLILQHCQEFIFGYSNPPLNNTWVVIAKCVQRCTGNIISSGAWLIKYNSDRFLIVWFTSLSLGCACLVLWLWWSAGPHWGWSWLSLWWVSASDVNITRRWWWICPFFFLTGLTPPPTLLPSHSPRPPATSVWLLTHTSPKPLPAIE